MESVTEDNENEFENDFTKDTTNSELTSGEDMFLMYSIATEERLSLISFSEKSCQTDTMVSANSFPLDRFKCMSLSLIINKIFLSLLSEYLYHNRNNCVIICTYQ